MTATTLFGAPLGYTQDTLARWIRHLEQCWTAFATRGPGELHDDLESLRPFFATGANAKSLRATMAGLPPTRDLDLVRTTDLTLPFEDRALITPEGRVLLDVLHALRDTDEYVISDDRVLWAHHIALTARSTWSREWADKQLDGNMSPPVLGAACFLLINGSVGLPQALRLPEDDTEDRALGRLVLPVLGNFSESLSGKAPALDSGLRSHWVFTQVSRLLPLDVRREKIAGGTALYIREDRERVLVSNLHDRLARFDVLAVEAAITQLIADYRSIRGALIAVDQSFEEPRHTQAIQRALTTRP